MNTVEKDLAIVLTKPAGVERYSALIRIAVQETLPGGLFARATIYAALAQAEATYLGRFYV